jgi:hypothetical protein
VKVSDSLSFTALGFGNLGCTVGRTESSLRDSRTYWLQLQSSAITGSIGNTSPLPQHC